MMSVQGGVCPPRPPAPVHYPSRTQPGRATTHLVFIDVPSPSLMEQVRCDGATLTRLRIVPFVPVLACRHGQIEWWIVTD